MKNIMLIQWMNFCLEPIIYFFFIRQYLNILKDIQKISICTSTTLLISPLLGHLLSVAAFFVELIWTVHIAGMNLCSGRKFNYFNFWGERMSRTVYWRNLRGNRLNLYLKIVFYRHYSYGTNFVETSINKTEVLYLEFFLSVTIFFGRNRLYQTWCNFNFS